MTRGPQLPHGLRHTAWLALVGAAGCAQLLGLDPMGTQPDGAGGSGAAGVTTVTSASGGGAVSSSGEGGMGTGGTGGLGAGGDEGSAGGAGGGIGGALGDGGAGGQGGSGGTPCFDNDDDGITDCDGDCDDGDPTVHPGATEICGDGVDNACGQNPDPAATCMGLGTFVSAAIGNDANPGTKAAPVATIAEAITHATTIGGPIAIYVAEGTYSEAVQVVEGVSMLGGYVCPDANGCTWARDPENVESTLQAVDTTGLTVASDVTRATAVEGFRIRGLDNQDTHTSTVTITMGSPTLRGNWIYGVTTAAVCPENKCNSQAITYGNITDAAGPFFEGNTIVGGTSPRGSYGVNTAYTVAAGEWVGNTITSGSAPTSTAFNLFGVGGTVILRDNTMDGGDCGGSGFSSNGVALAGQVMVLDNNRVNLKGTTTCAVAECNGIVFTDGDDVTLTNNVVAGCEGTDAYGLRVRHVFFDWMDGALEANGNTIYGTLPGTMNVTTSAAINLEGNLANARTIGTLRNNILFGGDGTTSFGILETGAANPPLKPVAVANNDFFGATILWRRWDSTSNTDLTTLAAVNGETEATANIDDDCQVDMTHHLPMGSACIDKGTADGIANTDMDGDMRPQGGGVDIGADEAM